MPPLQRYHNDPSCVFSEDLSSVTWLEDHGCTVNGGPVSVRTPWGPGLQLDGTSDYFTLDGFESQLRFDGAAQDFTVIMNFKKTDPTGTIGILFDKRDANDDGYRMAFLNDVIYSSVNAVDSIYSLTDIGWHTAAMVCDRSANMDLYIDTQSEDSDSINGETLATTADFVIGASSAGASPFKGIIKNFLVFSRLLTSAEISNFALGRSF